MAAPLIALTGGCLAWGHVALLDHADFQLDAHERVALIGRNGSGKSSLMAALADVAHLDDGEIWRAPGLKIGYVSQEPQFDAGATVYAAVVAGMGETSALLAEYHAVSHHLAEPDADTEHLLARLHDLQEALEARGAWSFASRAEQVIQRFGLDPDAGVDTLSGGQKKRLALARALAEAPDLLLLDEPTNHLDIDAIAWLEDFLLESGVTLVLITHDRRFLDRLATRTVELDRGRLSSFPCGFAEYQSRKEQM
ncbi:MAG TPA: ATP-binding cassette domain-containing protein, partial [Burkholderiales bacterium]